ncbi:MAG: undecaprenyl-diphosphate phosphatase [Candidatus Altiarchaeota archaeon]
MDVFSGFLVGLLQGVTEWLPISSSGQSMLVALNFLGLDSSNAFSLALYLHFGTLLAVLVKFRGDLEGVVRLLPRFREDSLTKFLVYSTVFTGVFGLPLYILLKGSFFDWQGEFFTGLIGLMLVFTGLILGFSRELVGVRGVSALRFTDTIWAGLAQSVAILPGVSRSGLTVAVLLARRVDAATALRLSFLMSVPAVFGAVLLEAVTEGFSSLGVDVVVAGIISSFVFGYLMIDVLMRMSRRIRFDLFCVIFGLLAVVVAVVPYL